MKLKVFEISFTSLHEKEWVAARTIIEALQEYLSTTGTDMVDFDPLDDIVEVPEDQWEALVIINNDYDASDPDDWQSMTFAQYMKDKKSPCIIAGTMYQ